MPEHVQHPNRFTVYELDELLTVGGGDNSANPRPQPSSVGLPSMIRCMIQRCLAEQLPCC